MKNKVIGYYLTFLFLAVTGYWILTLSQGNAEEGTIEISFHVFSELLMAIVCLFGGILLIQNKKTGVYLSIAGLSMVLYSVLNAAGYFGEKSDWPPMILFIVLFLVTVVALIALIRKQ